MRSSLEQGRECRGLRDTSGGTIERAMQRLPRLRRAFLEHSKLLPSACERLLLARRPVAPPEPSKPTRENECERAGVSNESALYRIRSHTWRLAIWPQELRHILRLGCYRER